MKRILITGTGSFIGVSFEKWINQFQEDYEIQSVSTLEKEWEALDFTNYDVVLNVAGIAHRKIKPQLEPLFYKINKELAKKICIKAKESGVKQYIYLSSMNVYGDINKKITKDTIPKPSNFYGMSKLKADIAIQKLNSNDFNVVSIRPPVVYGSGCKGNFIKLNRIAKYTPIFPDYSNHRSIIYIDNLCQFIKLLIDNNESGIFYPQNREIVSTTDIVREIALKKNHKVIFTKIFNPVINFLIPRIRTINRAFGDDLYDMELSSYKDFSYCIVSFKDSIARL